ESLRAEGHMTRRRVEYFEDVLRDVPGTVLEVGSGTGTLLRRLAGNHPDRRFTGVEPLPNYVDFANGRSKDLGLENVVFEVGTGEALPASVADSSVTCSSASTRSTTWTTSTPSSPRPPGRPRPAPAGGRWSPTGCTPTSTCGTP
ncbi:MAG: class I SAM-dependent methyltransferase, partial [Quadrisphaera sp.]